MISPYNFVPPPEKIVLPEWADHASHDIPFEDGISGHFDVEVTARTDILVGDGDGDGFSRDPDGRYAIPGTSLRGMLRSVIEIAGFGRIAPFNNQRYGFRDLQNRREYGDHMAAIVRGEPTPLVNAGWLVRDGEQWAIEPCHFAKAEYGMLEGLARNIGVKGFRPNEKQSAVKKYEAFGDLAFQTYDCPVVLTLAGGQTVGGVKRISGYGVAGRGQPQRGRLVFTGQPQDRRAGDKNKKHHDFLFFGEAGEPIPVSAQQREDFEFIHRADRAQHRDTVEPNEEWGFWLKQWPRVGRVPVFFLLKPDGGLRAFGLAMMFKLAYDQTTGDAVEGAQAGLAGASSTAKVRHWPDLAEAMFGYVRGNGPADKQRGALRGRVAIGQGRVQGEVRPTSVVEAVFGAPKASFYPHYLQQGRDVDGVPPQEGGKPVWSTYMDPKLKARGWKRYLVQPRANRRPLMPDKAKDDHKSRFAPLPAGTRFVARVRVHNLRPMELGALIWALDFGGHAGAMHQIGRGRPLGFGAVTLRLTAEALRTVVGGKTVAAASTVEAFTGYMQAATGEKWASSRTLFELLSMVTPVDEGEARQIRYPTIQPNQFNDIKKNGPGLLPWGGRAKWEAWKKERPSLALRADREWTGSLLPKLPKEEPEEAGGAAPIATPDQAPVVAEKPRPREAEAAPPWAGWVEVMFLDFNGARETRKNWAKKKEKERRLRVRAVVGRGEGEMSTLRTGGVFELFAALATANAAFSFFARVDDGVIAAVALALPPEATG